MHHLTNLASSGAIHALVNAINPKVPIRSFALSLKKCCVQIEGARSSEQGEQVRVDAL